MGLPALRNRALSFSQAWAEFKAVHLAAIEAEDDTRLRVSLQLHEAILRLDATPVGEGDIEAWKEFDDWFSSES